MIPKILIMRLILNSMEKMEMGGGEGRRYAILFVIIVIALLIFGIRLLWEEEYSVIYSPGCMIEHGNGECINGYLAIPFYNPNQQDIARIRITVPFGVRTNITLPADFTVNEPLNPRGTGVLTLFPCEEDVDVRAFAVEWCCGGECYRGFMSLPSNQLMIDR